MKNDFYNKKVNTVKVMFNRELKSFFASPMAYVVGVIFLVITGFLVFNFFFLGKKAELRSFLTNLRFNPMSLLVRMR